MITLKTLMAAGDDLLETRVLQGKPDWEALHDTTPDDTLPGEGGFDDDDDDDEPVAASAATPGELVRQMEEMAESGLLDPDAAAAALAAAWIEGAVAVAAGGYDPNQPRDPGGEGGGQWIKEGTPMKARRLKKGVKVGSELYNRENPAPPGIAFEAASKLADPEDGGGDFGRILSEMGHRNWPETVPGALDYRDQLYTRFEQRKALANEAADSVRRATMEALGVTDEQVEEIAAETTAYTASAAGKDKFSNLVFRGETEPPVFESARLAGGSQSRISESQYPVVEVRLSNGASFFEKIRLSNHAQVSSNAPRHYQYDYRAKTLAEAADLPEFSDDMDELAADLWDRQKMEWQRLKNDGVTKVEAGGYDPNQPRDPGGEGGGQWIKEGGVTSKITPEVDAAYLAAVESGDLETADELLVEAARASGALDPEGDGKLYHGTRAKFDRFKVPAFFSDDPEALEFQQKNNSSHDYGNTIRPFFLFGKFAEVEIDPEIWAVRDFEDYHIQQAQESGADGVIFTNGYDYFWVSLNADKIASAETIERDEVGNVIPLSQRFNQFHGDSDG